MTDCPLCDAKFESEKLLCEHMAWTHCPKYYFADRIPSQNWCCPFCPTNWCVCLDICRPRHLERLLRHLGHVGSLEKHYHDWVLDSVSRVSQ